MRLRWLLPMVVVIGLCVVLVGRPCWSDDGDDTGDADDWVAPPAAAKVQNPIKADAASIAAGKDIYTTTCMRCHGAAGKGDGDSAGALVPPPKDLSDPRITSQTDGSLFWKISTGKNAMLPFGKPATPGKPPDLSETQRWQVVNYLRVLCPPPATQP